MRRQARAGPRRKESGYVHKNRLLDEHCQTIGRDPAEIKRSVCLFADVEPDASKARGKREFLGKALDDEGRRNLLFGTPQEILDGVGRILGGLDIDEIIFCGLDQHPERYHRFDEEVLAQLAPARALVAT